MRKLLATLAVLPTLAATSAPHTMTLAEAKRLSPQQLAERLLGAAGASGGYVEANVFGDGGIMIHLPGLNSIDLYKRPNASGNRGLCQVDGVHVEFSSSRYDTPGDPPHQVTDFWKFTRFAMIDPSGDISKNGGSADEKRACAALRPVAGQTDPAFFAIASDNANDAHFAMRAVVKAQLTAASIKGALSCKADAGEKAICDDPAASIADIPIRRIHYAKVERCPDPARWCVHATWEKSSNGKDPRMVELDIQTDAAKVDWGTDFTVTAVKITSGVWIVD